MILGFIGTGNITSDVIAGISNSKINYKKIIISPRNKKKAEMALEEGLLASVYGDSQRMLRSYALSKKYLNA